MITPGLVSVTFRQLPPRELIALVVKAGLGAIEWGSDVHVPTGDLQRARQIGCQTREAGLAVAAYGSYYQAGQSMSDGVAFERVLETAMELGAPAIRVWAGSNGSDQTDEPQRALIMQDLRRIGDLAASAGVAIGTEFHPATLTDTNDSAVRLFEEVAHPNVHSYWQPPHGEPLQYCIEGLDALLPWLSNLHVFHWWPTLRQRHPLAVGEERWRCYLELVHESGRDHFALLEFVRDDSPQAFLEDAATLRRWLAAL